MLFFCEVLCFEAMCTALTLRCVRLEPRWASAAAQLRTGGAWHELSEERLTEKIKIKRKLNEVTFI